MSRKIDGIIFSPTTPVVGQRLWAVVMLDYKERFEYGQTAHLTAVQAYEPPDKFGVAFVTTRNHYYMVIPNVAGNDFPSL